MFERLQDYFHSEPRRITGFGRLLVNIGAGLLLAGAIGHFAVRTTNILPTLAKQPQTNKTLADIYPTLPLWWVPESWLAVTGVVVLLALGICVVFHGKNAERI